MTGESAARSNLARVGGSSMRVPALLVTFLLSLSALAGCLEPEESAEDDPVVEEPVVDDPFTSGDVQPRSLASGAHSGIVEPANLLIKEEAEWAELWERTDTAFGNGSGEAMERPQVDFDEEWVIAVLGGELPNACWSIRVTNVAIGLQYTEVEVTQARPGEDMACAEVVVTPYHYVAVPHLREPVQFKLEVAEAEAQST